MGILLALGSEPARAAPWSPPAGIPVPPFGITQAASPSPSPWSTPVAGFYYIDETAGAATDTSNPYGTPAKPRRTIPSSLPAGAVVELHGSYSRAHTSPNGISASGSASQPVYVRGAAGATVTRGWEIKGTYLIIEGLKFDASVGGGGWTVLDPADRIAIRDCEVEGTLDADGGLWVQVWGSGNVSNVVFLRNNVHHTGDWQASYDQDGHGTGLYRSSGGTGTISNVWILDSQYSYNSGDGIQINANGSANNGKIHHVYVGRNVAHHNKQAGFWSKMASDVIFSQNEAYEHRPSDSSSGQCMGYQYGPENVWFLFNEVHDCDYGIQVVSDDATGKNVYLIGNVIYRIHGAGVATDPYNPSAIHFRGGTNRYLVGNTIHDADVGITSPVSYGFMYMVDNLITAPTKSQGSHVFLESSSLASASTLHHNLFAGGAKIRWGGPFYTSVASFNSGSGKTCTGCLESQPQFVNAAGDDYRLVSGSPGVEGGVADAVYDTFQSRYGIDIRLDAGLNARPQGFAWDIGAYELPDVVPDVSVADAATQEGNLGARSLSFDVTLSEPCFHSVRVDFTTVNLQAIGGSDFTALGGSLVFPPGAVARSVQIAVLGDYVHEADEQFLLRLTAATGGTLVRSDGVGTILNDDSPGLTVADAWAMERPGAVVRFVVTLAPPQATEVTVGYATSNGSAQAGADYASANGSLSFAPAATERYVDVPVLTDSLAEHSEAFTLTLFGASGSPIARATAAGRIFDAGVFFTLQPCRLIDTRGPAGPFGGPALVAGQQRSFSLAGRCAIPATARAVAVNVTATEPTTQGHLIWFPAGAAVPLTSTVNYTAGRTIANNAIVPVGTSAGLTVRCGQASGTTHVVVDVVGYFE